MPPFSRCKRHAKRGHFLGGSDGSWTQAQSADLSGTTPNGITPNDGLYANDPRRAQAQQMPVPAGQPA
eukprot:3548032-Pyramimonas_sp.AAC.1